MTNQLLAEVGVVLAQIVITEDDDEIILIKNIDYYELLFRGIYFYG